MRSHQGLSAATILIALIAMHRCLSGNEPAKETVATRPFLYVFASSINRIQAACEIVFDSVDRPDLSDSLSDRLKQVRDFSGIARSNPLGLLQTWNSAESSSVIFLPVDQIDELMKTATFDIVGYHQVGPDQYEIERPEFPYHVLIKEGYAYFADAIQDIKTLRVTPDQLTNGLRDRYEAAVVIDARQIPVPERKKFVDQLRTIIEPLLQMQDDEISESANLRKTLGKLVLDMIQRVSMDTNRGIVGIHLDPDTRHLQVDMTIEAVKGSPMAAALNRWSSSRSEFSSLVSPDVPAGIAINLPLTGLVEQILGPSNGSPKKGSRLDAGFQLVGQERGQFSLIAALSGNDAAQLNDAIPDLMVRLEKSGNFVEVRENIEVHNHVVFHSAIPREIPSMISQLTGTDTEIVVGQGKTRVWVGIGKSESILEQLKDAVDAVELPSTDQPGASLVRARFQANQIPQLLPSDLLAPNVDNEAARAALEKGGDGFSLTLEPIENGIRLRLDADEGLVRLIGRDWVKQIENATRQ